MSRTRLSPWVLSCFLFLLYLLDSPNCPLLLIAYRDLSANYTTHVVVMLSLFFCNCTCVAYLLGPGPRAEEGGGEKQQTDTHAKVEAALKCMKKRNLTFACPCLNLPELSFVVVENKKVRLTQESPTDDGRRTDDRQKGRNPLPKILSKEKQQQTQKVNSSSIIKQEENKTKAKEKRGHFFFFFFYKLPVLSAMRQKPLEL